MKYFFTFDCKGLQTKVSTSDTDALVLKVVDLSNDIENWLYLTPR